MINIKTASYNIQLDPVIKIKAEETFAGFGLNLSEAINVFLHMSIKRNGFPFEVREPKLNSDTLLAIQETERILEEYSAGVRMPKPFTNAHEMFAAMDLEDAANDTYE